MSKFYWRSRTCSNAHDQRKHGKTTGICDEAPFYTLGPLTTDIAPGYDHYLCHRSRNDWIGTDAQCCMSPQKNTLACPIRRKRRCDNL
jgi:thiamine biosynthesis protein ThiC